MESKATLKKNLKKFCPNHDHGSFNPDDIFLISNPNQVMLFPKANQKETFCHKVFCLNAIKAAIKIVSWWSIVL